jgi:hypothetical protein
VKYKRGKDLKSWEEFLERVQELGIKYSKGKSSPKFICRGQGIKKWKLLTTLERHWKMDLSLRNYFRLISMIKPQIEFFTRKNWNITSLDEFDKMLEDNNGTLLFPRNLMFRTIPINFVTI